MDHSIGRGEQPWRSVDAFHQARPRSVQAKALAGRRAERLSQGGLRGQAPSKTLPGGGTGDCNDDRPPAQSRVASGGDAPFIGGLTLPPQSRHRLRPNGARPLLVASFIRTVGKLSLGVVQRCAAVVDLALLRLSSRLMPRCCFCRRLHVGERDEAERKGHDVYGLCYCNMRIGTGRQ